jgi:Zn-finger nucleic acid-binding protein
MLDSVVAAAPRRISTTALVAEVTGVWKKRGELAVMITEQVSKAQEPSQQKKCLF